MSLLELRSGTEAPGWWFQMQIQELVDLREAMFGVRLLFERPPTPYVETGGIRLDSGKCRKTGGKVQAAQVEANSTDPLVFPLDRPQGPPPHRPPHHPFLHTIYLHTLNTLYHNSLHFNQYLGTRVLWKSQSGVTSHLFKHLVEDLAVEVMVVSEHMEVVQLAQLVQLEQLAELVCPPLTLPMMATNTTSHMATRLILRSPRVLRSRRLQTGLTTDTPRVSTMTTPLPSSLASTPTQHFLPWWTGQDQPLRHQSGALSMSSFLRLEDPSLLFSSQFHLDEVLPTLHWRIPASVLAACTEEIKEVPFMALINSQHVLYRRFVSEDYQ